MLKNKLLLLGILFSTQSFAMTGNEFYKMMNDDELSSLQYIRGLSDMGDFFV